MGSRGGEHSPLRSVRAGAVRWPSWRVAESGRTLQQAMAVAHPEVWSLSGWEVYSGRAEKGGGEDNDPI